MNLSQTMNYLYRVGFFNANFYEVLRTLVKFGNEAAHGAIVDPAVANEVLQG